MLSTSTGDVSVKVFDLHSRYKSKSRVFGRKKFDLELILQANVFYISRKANFVHGMRIFLDTLKIVGKILVLFFLHKSSAA